VAPRLINDRLDMKAKKIIATAVVGNLAGVGLTYVALIAAPTFFGWWLCYCLFLFFSFPLGWLGVLLSKMLATKGIALLCFWGGVTLNACLWGWTVSRITRAVQRRKMTAQNAFDASAISARIMQLRHDHAVAAHARSHPLYSRKGLVAAARRALTRFAYFSGIGAQHSRSPEHEAPKNSP
jgi:hypothetical protein